MILVPAPHTRFDLNQGALVQTAHPVPPVSQPELSRYSAQEAQRYIVQTVPQIHQGATVLASVPSVPLPNQPQNADHYRPDENWLMWVGPRQRFEGPPPLQSIPAIPATPQPEPAWWYRPDENRYAWIGPEQFFEGATILRTDPIPPVSQPELSQFARLTAALLALTGPQLQFTGATVQQASPIPGISQPEFSYYRRITPAPLPSQVDQVSAAAPQMYTFERAKQFFGVWQQQGGVVADGGGPTTQQTYIFPVSQPEGLAGSQQVRYRQSSRPILETLVAATQPTYIFPPNQPETAGFTALQILRYIVDAPRRVDGPIAQQTYIFQPAQPEGLANFHQVRYRQDSRPVLETLLPPNIPSYIFPVNQPEPSQFIALQQSRYRQDAVKYADGVTRQQQYIFPVSQPEISGFLMKLNAPSTMTGPVAQFSGGTIQATAPIPPVSQPEYGYYRADRWQIPGVVARFDAAIVQQTYVFQPGQPEFSRIPPRAQPEVVKQFPQPVAQTYVFPVSQPDPANVRLAGYYHSIVPAATQLHQGATVQQTYVFTPHQPALAYTALNRTYLAFLHPPIEAGTAPVVITSPPRVTVVPGWAKITVS